MTVPVSIDQLVARPDHISQATAVEQVRAVAEVAAAVEVAQRNPRDIDTARRALQASCTMFNLAEEAFYDFIQGGRVRGPSATLAREIGRCWGNFRSGSNELHRDTTHRYSEIKAWAWDLETNVERSVTFHVPHERDGTGAALTSVRDVRNNNNNWAARGEREMILSILPAWFVDEGVTLCQRTLDAGDGKTLDERRDRAVKAFEGLGVALDRIERKLGTKKDAWSVHDLAQLTQVHKAISRGVVTPEDEFPRAHLTIAEVTASRSDDGNGGQRRRTRKRAASQPPVDDAPPPDEPPGMAPSTPAPASDAPAATEPPPDDAGQPQHAPDDPERPFTEEND